MKRTILLACFVLAFRVSMAQTTRSFFPREVKTVAEFVSLFRNSETAEMKLFREILQEALSESCLMNRKLDRETLAQYFEKNLRAGSSPTYVSYAVSLPVDESRVSIIYRKADLGEVVFMLDIGNGTSEPLVLGKDGGLVCIAFDQD